MDKKMEVMIALGVAYGVNCQFCMEYHKKKAIEAGVTKEETRTVIQIAEGVKTGAANKTKQNAGDLFGGVKEKRCCPEGSECCP